MALGRLLARLGARRVFGAPIPGLSAPLTMTVDPASARALAEGDAVGIGLGASFDGSIVSLTSRPGAAPDVIRAPTARDFVDAVVDARVRGAGAISVELGFAPDEPTDDLRVPEALDPSIAPRLSGSHFGSDGGPFRFDLVLAGSGVIRGGAVEPLRGFAEQTGLGVLNVFTAKGLFRWDSPYHLGTAGLQLHDFAYAGISPDRPVLAIGVDRDECPDAILRDAGLAPEGPWPITCVEPSRLGPISSLVRAEHDGLPALGELYHRLSNVVQPLYRVEDVPLNPARAAADIGESLPDGGVVTLEPGTAGWWVARALPTTQLGSVRVPATGRRGLAIAAAITAALDGTPVIAVVEPPLGPHEALLEVARAAAVDLVVELWGDDGEIGSPTEHRDRLRAAFDASGVTVLATPVEFGPATGQLTEAAGPLAAWHEPA